MSRVSADVDLKGKLKYIVESVVGLYRAIFATLNPNGINDPWLSRLLAGVVLLCHLLLAPIVVCPLAALYVCGPLLSAGISVWRLIERDYGLLLQVFLVCLCFHKGEFIDSISASRLCKLH